MSERVGSVKLGGGDSEPFMGMRGTDSSQEFSQHMAAVVDEEVAALIHTAHQEAFDVLVENRDVLDELVRQLFEKETLNKEQVAEVFKPLRRREKRPAWTGSDLRIPSDQPPVEVPAAPEPPAEKPAQLPPPPSAGPDFSAGPPAPTPEPPPTGPSPWGPPTAPPSPCHGRRSGRRP
ncbi:MAG: cell division protein FtsH, partial [Propionibacteriaceae bacterium]|nr:cell division protein FtsH [Propionibacteriaceae bacterium]